MRAPSLDDLQRLAPALALVGLTGALASFAGSQGSAAFGWAVLVLLGTPATVIGVRAYTKAERHDALDGLTARHLDAAWESFGIRSAATRFGITAGIGPGYIINETIDAELDEALDHGTCVLLAGDRLTGVSRAAYEAARRCAERRRWPSILVGSQNRTAAEQLARLDSRRRRTGGIVWLGELSVEEARRLPRSGVKALEDCGLCAIATVSFPEKPERLVPALRAEAPHLSWHVMSPLYSSDGAEPDARWDWRSRPPRTSVAEWLGGPAVLLRGFEHRNDRAGVAVVEAAAQWRELFGSAPTERALKACYQFIHGQDVDFEDGLKWAITPVPGPRTTLGMVHRRRDGDTFYEVLASVRAAVLSAPSVASGDLLINLEGRGDVLSRDLVVKALNRGRHADPNVVDRLAAGLRLRGRLVSGTEESIWRARAGLSPAPLVDGPCTTAEAQPARATERRSRRVRGVVLIAGVLVVAVITALSVIDGDDGRTASGETSASPATDRPAAQALDGIEHTQVLGVEPGKDCPRHSTGEIQRFLSRSDHQCAGLWRSVWTTTDDEGAVVVLAVNEIQLPDRAVALIVADKVVTPGTGNIKPLLTDGPTFRDAPTAFGEGAVRAWACGDRAIAVVADWQDSRREPDESRLGTAADRGVRLVFDDPDEQCVVGVKGRS